MKQLLSIFIAVLVAITAFGQTSPPNKLRSNDSFTQVDNYLVAAKRLGIPSGPTPTLNGSTAPENSSKLFYATNDNTLYVYDPIGGNWSPVSSDVDLSNYWTIAQVDSAITAEIGDIPPQTLSLGSTGGEITISGGNSISLSSLATGTSISSSFTDWMNDSPNQSGGFFSTTSGATGVPSTIGQGIWSRRLAGTLNGALAFWTANNGNEEIYYTTGSGASLNDWKVIADRDWVNSVIPSTPTLQQVTDEGNSTTNNINTSASVQANAFNGLNASLTGTVQVGNLEVTGSASWPDAPTSIDHLTNKAYVDLQSVMEPIDEGNGIGYRIRGSNPNNYGDIGLGAVDFSFSNSASTTRGALGDRSFAIGRDVSVLAHYGVSFGSNNSMGAGAQYSLVGGVNNTINDEIVTLHTGNVIWGRNNTYTATSGTSEASVILGTANTISGSGSVGLGYLNSSTVGPALLIGTQNTTEHTQATMALSPVMIGSSNSNGTASGGVYLGRNLLGSTSNQQVIIGRWNAPETGIGKIIFGVGSGNSTRANGLTIDGGGAKTEYDLEAERFVIAGTFRVSELNEAPPSSSSTGSVGEIRITGDYIYVCTAINTWVRAELNSW